MTTPHQPAPPAFDPGLTQQYTGALLRAINKDGSFNVYRKGFRSAAGSAYIQLVRMPWHRFFAIFGCAYLLVNCFFASIYVELGRDALHASERDQGLVSFAQAFFFSAQTLTTVGYGSLYPFGLAANMVSSVEVAMGLAGFALATSLMFARFSRPSAKLVFSSGMVVAPYRDVTSLQFRVANQRSNVLMDLQADLMLMTVEQGPDGKLKRNFVELALERKRVNFLALTWTVVHPIDQTSPLFGKTQEDMERLQAELLILLRGFDDAFSQVVHTRYSYRWDEIEWAARFVPAFEVSDAGQLVLDVGKIGITARVEAAG
jgi:inward rectifier potassium channel